MFTTLLWIVGGGLGVLCTIAILAGILSRDVRRSGFGGGAWINAIMLLPMALLLVWWAWSRSN